MRKLKTSDIPAFCRGLKQLGIKEQIREIAQKSDNMEEAWDYGFDLIWSLFDMATEKQGETTIYELLSGPFEMEPDAIRDMDMSEFIDSCKQLAAENNLRDFFKFAAQSMK